MAPVDPGDDDRDDREYAGMFDDDSRPVVRCQRRYSVPGIPAGRWRQCRGRMEWDRCRVCGMPPRNGTL